MNYALGYAFTLRDLYTKFPFQKLKFNGCSFENIFKTADMCIICSRILCYCVQLVITDIIRNNTTFVLPTGKKYAEIYVRRTSQEEFKCRRQKGGDQDIDFLETNFTTYKLSFRWMGKYLMRSKPCYVGTSLRDEFINNINNGVKYC